MMKGKTQTHPQELQFCSRKDLWKLTHVHCIMFHTNTKMPRPQHRVSSCHPSVADLLIRIPTTKIWNRRTVLSCSAILTVNSNTMCRDTQGDGSWTSDQIMDTAQRWWTVSCHTICLPLTASSGQSLLTGRECLMSKNLQCILPTKGCVRNTGKKTELLLCIEPLGKSSVTNLSMD